MTAAPANSDDYPVEPLKEPLEFLSPNQDPETVAAFEKIMSHDDNAALVRALTMGLATADPPAVVGDEDEEEILPPVYLTVSAPTVDALEPEARRQAAVVFGVPGADLMVSLYGDIDVDREAYHRGGGGLIREALSVSAPFIVRRV